ncbi:MAG: NAD(P)H-binding protein [Betaproteobacteria bacterium]|nr:NAD(P)H-binding protein [Betaproteobacteria bacterium]
MTKPNQTSGQRLLLLGASGAVGSQVLALASADERVAQIIAPSRRALGAAPKLMNPVMDFAQDELDADWLNVDSVVCALGTTLREAGSQAAFAFVDRDLPVRFAKLAHQHGAKSFALNSSLGASPKANFYLKTKAQAEAAIAALGFESYTVVRPSLIDAVREKSRPGEVIGLAVARVFQPLIPARYRPVSAKKIAQALLDAALQGKPGHRVIESDAL